MIPRGLIEKLAKRMQQFPTLFILSKVAKPEATEMLATAFLTAIAKDVLSAFRDGKVEILCPECNEPIKVLKCEPCHLENVDGYIRH